MQLEVIGGLCMLLVQIPLLSRFTFLDQATFWLHVMELLVFFMLFFLASGVSIYQLCSGVCRGDGLHGVPWVKTAGRRHHGHM